MFRPPEPERKYNIKDWDAWTWFIVAIFALIFVLAVFAFVNVVTESFTSDACREQAEMLGLPWRWSYNAGCYVNTPERGWWPLSQYIIR